MVDIHAPEGTVHEQALQNGTEVVEIHLRAEREFTGRRRTKALDASPDSQGEITGTRRWTDRSRCPQPPLPQTEVQGVWRTATAENNNGRWTTVAG